jgi:small subunit ribosomal protein S1
MKFGIFARLDEGVEGLIHISCINQNNDHPNLHRMFAPGQRINVRILHIDAERRRLGLGLVSEE